MKWSLNILILLGIIITSCTSSSYISSGVDDVYYTPSDKKIKDEARPADDIKTKPAEATEKKSLDEIQEEFYSILDNDSIVETDTMIYKAEEDENPYDEVLADSYEEAWKKRMEAREDPWYGMYNPSVFYSNSYWYASAFDPFFYNIVVSGSQVWVEPWYISSSFSPFWGRFYYPYRFGYGYPYYWYGYPYYGGYYYPYWAQLYNDRDYYFGPRPSRFGAGGGYHSMYNNPLGSIRNRPMTGLGRPVAGAISGDRIVNDTRRDHSISTRVRPASAIVGISRESTQKIDYSKPRVVRTLNNMVSTNVNNNTNRITPTGRVSSNTVNTRNVSDSGTKSRSTYTTPQRSSNSYNKSSNSQRSSNSGSSTYRSGATGSNTTTYRSTTNTSTSTGSRRR